MAVYCHNHARVCIHLQSPSQSAGILKVGVNVMPLKVTPYSCYEYIHSKL